VAGCKRFFSVGGVEFSINAEVAALASCDHVPWNGAWWVTGAEVSGGEVDCASGVQGAPVVVFHAAAGVWVWLVQAALAGAFARVACPDEPYPIGEVAPICRVACGVNGHDFQVTVAKWVAHALRLPFSRRVRAATRITWPDLSLYIGLGR